MALEQTAIIDQPTPKFTLSPASLAAVIGLVVRVELNQNGTISVVHNTK